MYEHFYYKRTIAVQICAGKNKPVLFYISQYIFTPPLYEILNLTSEKYGT